MSAAASSGATRRSLSASPSEDSDRLEAAADEAIAACNGDMRSAIRALILANEYLEYELCEMFAAVSKGYARGRVKPIDADGKPIERAAMKKADSLPDGNAA
ncbi:MAG: hypothetical protein AB1586_33630 [Pseudomonadota bacterium]|jgi:hypothetical protein